MKILVDQEGRRAVEQLCDIALKSAGVRNLDAVNEILASILLLPIPEEILAKANTQPKSFKKDDKASSSAATEKQEEVKEEEAEAKVETKAKEEAPDAEAPKEVVEDKAEPVKE